ncbi:hypothetical protein, conserved, partial [Leishmania shawi]
MTSQDQHTENAACVDSGEFAPQEQAEGAPGAAEQSLTFADEENPDPPCEVQRAEDCPEQSVPLEDLETQGHEAPAPEEYGEELAEHAPQQSHPPQYCPEDSEAQVVPQQAYEEEAPQAYPEETDDYYAAPQHAYEEVAPRYVHAAAAPPSAIVKP